MILALVTSSLSMLKNVKQIVGQTERWATVVLLHVSAPKGQQANLIDGAASAGHDGVLRWVLA